MRDFIKRALKKTNRMTLAQIREVLTLFEEEYDILAGALDSLSLGVIICDVPGAVIQHNKAAIRCFAGCFADAAGEHPVWECIKNEEISSFIRETIENEENACDRFFCISVDGANIYLDISVMPLVLEKRVAGSIITVKNITESKEEEIKNRRLESLASLTSLAASVAHEIKNPLASISIYVQLLKKKLMAPGSALAEDEGVKKALDVIASEIERLNKTIVNFLMAVRPVRLSAEPLCINSVVEDFASLVGEELKARGIALVLDLAEGIPMISGDAEKLRQVFLNFVKNAQDAIEANAALLPAGEGRIAIRTKAEDAAVVVQIEDNGIGVSDEELPRIFEPYYTTKADGTGLGLPIAYKIIKEHGGDIQVCSYPGEGTCFTFVFPAIREATRLIGYDAAHDEESAS